MGKDIMPPKIVYDLDLVQNPKNCRRGGLTTSLIMNAIGMLMVTDGETIPFIIATMDRTKSIKKIFTDICLSHFKEETIFYNEFRWGIKGYNSSIKFIGFEQQKKELIGLRIAPLVDPY